MALDVGAKRCLRNQKLASLATCPLESGELAAADQIADVLVAASQDRSRFGPKQQVGQVCEDLV